jgi:hypothetical protein
MFPKSYLLPSTDELFESDHAAFAFARERSSLSLGLKSSRKGEILRIDETSAGNYSQVQEGGSVTQITKLCLVQGLPDITRVPTSLWTRCPTIRKGKEEQKMRPCCLQQLH